MLVTCARPYFGRMPSTRLKTVEAELSAQELLFCKMILEGKTGTESAILASYAPRSAAGTGSSLLSRPHIIAYLAEQRSKTAQRIEISQDSISAELSKLAFANIEDLTTVDHEGQPVIDFSRATRAQLAAVTSVKTKVRTIYNSKGQRIATEKDSAFTLADKYQGLKLLGQQLGMFNQPDQHITIDIADRLLRARQRDLRLTDQRGGDEVEDEDAK